MRIDRGGIVTGLMLILVGTFVLLNNMGLVPDFGANVWALVFGAGSLLFLVVYLSSGLQNWGWLFPTSVLGALAAVIALSEMGVEREWVGSIFLWGVALPFWGAYVVQRGRAWLPILPAGILTSVGFAPVLSNVADGEIAGSAFLFGMGLTFLLVYLASKREHWWPLIPAGVLTLLSLITFLAEVASDNVIGLVFLSGVGGVFLAIFLLRREQWWAMIPAGIMLTAGTVAALEPSLRGAGFWQERLGAGIFYTGLALTFGILWLMREKMPPDGRSSQHWDWPDSRFCLSYSARIWKSSGHWRCSVSGGGSFSAHFVRSLQSNDVGRSANLRYGCTTSTCATMFAWKPHSSVTVPASWNVNA